MPFKKQVVGIFSREHEDQFKWLILFLLTISRVKDVRPVYISNNFLNFQQEAFKCTFAILYHSKSRGRVNVTDVTDSLYDSELEYLNLTLGKKNVLVVIDDLEDSSDEVKSRILENQPSIRRLAQQLFLFSSAEKALLSAGDGGPGMGYQSHPDLRDKMESLKKHVAGKRTREVRRPARGADPEGDPGGDPGPDSGNLLRRRQRRRLCIIVWVSVFAGVVIVAIILATTLKPKS